MKALLHALLALALAFATLPASAASYTFRSDTFSWESAANAISWDRKCTSYPGDDDQATITFSGGLSFPFGGTAYTSVRVLTNGALQFGADTGFMRTYTNTALPAGTASSQSGCARAATERTMMVYWTDLNPTAGGSGNVTWEQKGTAPNRYVVVSWNSVYQYGTSTPYAFQVILFENGEFKYQYGNSNATGSKATVGVQVSTSDYTQYSYNSGYNANGSAIRWVVPGSAGWTAHYKLDEYAYNGAVGEAKDAGSTGNHGVVVGGALSTAGGYVCRGLDVAANTNTTSRALDTLIDLNSSIGSSGGVSLWYRGNLAWTSSTPAMIADATQASSKAFRFWRVGGGALQFVVTDSAGTSLTATTAKQSFGAGTWVHVAATWYLASGSNQSTVRIYVNGTLLATTLGTTTGTLSPGLGTLFVGDNRSTNTSGATPNSANGVIDEVRVYSVEATSADLAADRAASHDCQPPLDHYELSIPSASLACLPTPVTVRACADSARPCASTATSVAGQTATLSTSGATLLAIMITFDANGVATTSLTAPTAADGAIVTVTLSGEQTVAANARQCCPDGANCSAADSCSTTFNTAGFIVAATSGGAAATVPTQTAGSASGGFYLRAVKTGTTTRACEAALSGAQAVNWSLQCLDPTTCSSGQRMTLTGSAATAIASNPASGVSASTAVPMLFDATGAAPFSFHYADVGRVRLSATKTVAGATLAGSSNAFVVKPASLAITSIRQTASPNTPNPGASAAGDAVFVRAGESFSATVTALGATGVATPNFGRETTPEGVQLSATLVQPAGGAAGTLANATVSGGSFASGAATATQLHYSEVGIVTLAANLASGSYLGAGAVSGPSTGNVGRFVPARFAVSGTSITHRSGLACTPASTFTYLGETFRLGLTLTAQNLAGATTANYRGDFARFNPANASAWQLAGRDGSTLFTVASGRLSLGSATGSWSNGVASNLTLTAAALRAAVADGPFNAAIGVAPVDSDGVTLGSFDMASASGGANDRASLGTLALRFGRLRLSSAIGAADRALALPAVVQHWTGSTWDTNTLDSCTTVPTTAMNFGNLRRTLTTADTAASAALRFTAGAGALQLVAPGGGRSGTYDVALSLGSGATDASCLQSWAPGSGDAATAGANLPFLRGAWCTSSFDKDPSARASFGLERTRDRVIYRREHY